MVDVQHRRRGAEADGTALRLVRASSSNLLMGTMQGELLNPSVTSDRDVLRLRQNDHVSMKLLSCSGEYRFPISWRMIVQPLLLCLSRLVWMASSGNWENLTQNCRRQCQDYPE